MGEIEADSGSFTWGVTTTRSYFPKDNSTYFDQDEINLIDWLRQYSPDQSEIFVRGFLGRMLFSGEDATKKTKVLSGGERVRCMLAKMMMIEANVLILDGPTNHLDLEAINALNVALQKFEGTVLLVTHDQDLMEEVGTRVWHFKDGKILDFKGPYEEYAAALPA